MVDHNGLSQWLKNSTSPQKQFFEEQNAHGLHRSKMADAMVDSSSVAMVETARQWHHKYNGWPTIVLDASICDRGIICTR